MDSDMFSDGGEAVLTTKQIQEWIDKREQRLREVAEWQEEISQLDDKLRAVELITGRNILGGANVAAPAEEEAEEKENMTEAAVRILKEAGHLMSNKELQAKLKEDPEFAERLRLNSNYYYTMMQRLVKRQRVIKEGSKYRAP